MQTKIRKVNIDNEAINPTLLIDTEIQFTKGQEVPISVSGILKINNSTTIATLSEHPILNPTSYPLEVFRESGNVTHYRDTLRIDLRAELTSLAIEAIEKQREKTNAKAVHFTVHYMIKTIVNRSKTGVTEENGYFEFKINKEIDSHTIDVGRWVNEFTDKLGIGKFMLLEMTVPEIKKVPEFWLDLYKQLIDNINSMNGSMKSGDWENTMFHARMFFENIKIGDNKPGHIRFKKELHKLLKKENHIDEGIKNFEDAIWKFFDFISKYIHNKDKNGNLKPIPKAKKEDAYFAYALAVGLLNLIGSKIQSD